jgi:UDP-3-O-[3-hydroxymyristoyl] glucosamine N-acyltransferase
MNACKITFADLVTQLELDPQHTSLAIAPERNPTVSGVAAIELATPDQLSFIDGKRYGERLQTTQARVLILPKTPSLWEQANTREIAWVSTDQPRLLFAKAIGLFYQPQRPEPGIHPTAVIHPSAKLGKAVAIAAQVVVGAEVEIGDRVALHPQVVIYAGCHLGEGTVVHSRAVIHERSHIGANCLIHSGAVIGSEGFGFVPTASGWFKMPQSGCVILEPEVEVGCNSTIDRPAVGDTRIGRGTKIDNLVQVGHGCQIGPNCVLVAQVGLAGRVQLGQNVVLAGQVGVSEGLKVGDGAVILAQSGLVEDADPGAMLCGSPALPQRLFWRATALFRRLPEWSQTLKQLQKRLPPETSVAEE